MSKPKKTTYKQKLLLILSGLVLSIVLLEMILHLGGAIYLSIQEYRNKVALKQDNSYRILCLGESTTAEIIGTKSYPSQLQEILNHKNIGKSFSVINKGIIGTALALT